jgi:hypothetical protein
MLKITQVASPSISHFILVDKWASAKESPERRHHFPPQWNYAFPSTIRESATASGLKESLSNPKAFQSLGCPEAQLLDPLLDGECRQCVLCYRVKTLTKPSPPPLTTQRPS